MRVIESLLVATATSHEPAQGATSNATPVPAPAPAPTVESDPTPAPVPAKTTTRGRKRAISPPAEMPPPKRSSRTRATSRVAVEPDAPAAEHTMNTDPTIDAPVKSTARGRKPSARQAAAAKDVSTTRKTSRVKKAAPVVDPEPEDNAEAEVGIDVPAAPAAEHTTTTAPTIEEPTKSTARTRKPSARQAAQDASTTKKTSRAKKAIPVIEPEPELEEAPDAETEPTAGRSSRSRGRGRKTPAPVTPQEKTLEMKTAAPTGRASKKSTSKTTSTIEVAGPSEM